MTQELLYTSAPKGLKPGSRGFCTVVSTQGLPAPLVTALEGLSAYRPVYPHGDPRAADNPVNWSHMLLSAGGRPLHVLSRVADYGLDYSQRSNKLAHHVVLSDAECVAAGPAWVLQQPGVLQAAWDGAVRTLPQGRAIPRGRSGSLRAAAWERATGDAGWAGVVAEALQADPNRQVFFIFSPGMDLLPLVSEVLALLPEPLRWKITFSTYCTQLPPNATCQWRCHLEDSPEAQQSQRFVKGLRIDLTKPLGAATGGGLVSAARTGEPTFAANVPVIPSSTDEVVDLEFATIPSAWNSPPPPTPSGGPQPSYQLQPSAGPRPVRIPGLPPELPVRKRSWGLTVLFSTLAALFVAALGTGTYVGLQAKTAANEQLARAVTEANKKVETASLQELSDLEDSIDTSLQNWFANATPESATAKSSLEKQRETLEHLERNRRTAAAHLEAARQQHLDNKYSDAIEGLVEYRNLPGVTEEQLASADALLAIVKSDEAAAAKALPKQPATPATVVSAQGQPTAEPVESPVKLQPPTAPTVSNANSAVAARPSTGSSQSTKSTPLSEQPVEFLQEDLPLTPTATEASLVTTSTTEFALLHPELQPGEYSWKTTSNTLYAIPMRVGFQTTKLVALAKSGAEPPFDLRLNAKPTRQERTWCAVFLKDDDRVLMFRKRFDPIDKLPANVRFYDGWAKPGSFMGVPYLRFSDDMDVMINSKRLNLRRLTQAETQGPEKSRMIATYTLDDPSKAATQLGLPLLEVGEALRVDVFKTDDGIRFVLNPQSEHAKSELASGLVKHYAQLATSIVVKSKWSDLDAFKTIRPNTSDVEAYTERLQQLSVDAGKRKASAESRMKMEEAAFAKEQAGAAVELKQLVEACGMWLTKANELFSGMSNARMCKVRVYYRLIATPPFELSREVDVVKIDEAIPKAATTAPPSGDEKAAK